MFGLQNGPVAGVTKCCFISTRNGYMFGLQNGPVAGVTSFNQDVTMGVASIFLSDVFSCCYKFHPSCFSKMTITFGRLQNSSSQVTIRIRDQFWMFLVVS